MGQQLQQQLRQFWRRLVSPRLRLKLYWIRRGFRTLSFFQGLRFAAASLLGSRRPLPVFVSHYARPLWVRPNTSDIAVLHQVFIDECYRLPCLKSARFIIDGGANVGYAAVWFALHHPEARIVAVEPEESNFALLQLNTRHLPSVHPMRKAIWSERCQLTIANPADEKWEFRLARLAGPCASIETVTIPELIQWAASDRIDLLKLDVEGAENEIFAADSAWLACTRYVIIELHDYLIPGCGDSFRNAIRAFPFKRASRGEHEIFSNTDLHVSGATFASSDYSEPL
jgi:FkbM family methyltransferase